MATKTQAYDHPAYLVPETFNFGIGTSPSGGASGRLTAFTGMIAKNAVITVSIAGTATSTVAVLRLNALTTATSTLASIIVGTGVVVGTSIGTSVGQTGSFTCSTTSLGVGDQVWVVNGVDLSVGYGITVEAYLVPGANLTV